MSRLPATERRFAHVRWHDRLALRPRWAPYLPSTLAAAALLAVLLLFTPTEWIRRHVLPEVPTPTSTAARSRDDAVRIVEIGAGAAAEGAAQIPGAEPTVDQITIEDAASPEVIRDDELFDPTARYLAARRDLLRASPRVEPPDLSTLLIRRPLASAVFAHLGTAEQDTVREAREILLAFTRAMLRTQGPAWVEEAWRERFDEWYERYVLDAED